LLTPSEEVTKTWIKRKGILIKSRPEPSRFSFAVCLAIVCSIAVGFLGGFLTAGFALNENFSSVYENLLTELNETRLCVQREKDKLFTLTKERDSMARTVEVTHANVRLNEPKPSAQMEEQAVFTVFNHAVELLQKNDKVGGCSELNNIINLKSYKGSWSNKAKHLLDKNCY
jgi:hypothetical protein